MTNKQKRVLEAEMVCQIRCNPTGIDTRKLITNALTQIRIPNANRYHAAGMLSWLLRRYNFQLLVRSPGRSIIA